MYEPPGFHDYILRKSLQPYSPKNDYMIISPQLSKNLSLYYVKQAALKRAQAKEKLTVNDFFKQKNRIPKPLNLEKMIPKTDKIPLKPRVPVIIKQQNEEHNEQKFKFDPRTDYAAKRSIHHEKLPVAKRLKQIILSVISEQEINEIVSTYRRMLISGEVRSIYAKQEKNQILRYGMNSSDNPLDFNQQQQNLDNQKEMRQLLIFKELAKRYNLNILDRLQSIINQVKLQLHEIMDPQLLKTDGNQSSEDLEDEKFQLIQERVKDNMQLKQLQLIEGLSELTQNSRRGPYNRRGSMKNVDANNKFIPITQFNDQKFMTPNQNQTKTTLTTLLSTKFQSRRESQHFITDPQSLQVSPNQLTNRTLFKSESQISHFKLPSNNKISIISNPWIRIQKDARQLKLEAEKKKQQLIENKRFNKQMGLNFNRFIDEFEDETNSYCDFKKQISTNIRQIMTNRDEELQDLVHEEESNHKYLSNEHKINRINELIKRRLLNFMVNQLKKNDQFILLNNFYQNI